MTLALRYAARSDVGMVRKGNEDSGYAGPHLLVIADGMGGHAFGEVASSAAMGVLVELEPAPDQPDGSEQPDGPHADPVAQVRDKVARAGDLLRTMITERPELEGMGTTVTALLQVGEQVVIAQVGDSRGYLLRDGVLELLTHDQTFVQSLIDEGRISHDAARTHPQRSLLLQALDGRVEVEPEITVRSPKVDDRYLLCSDGLSGVLSEATMREMLMVGTPEEAVNRLVDLSLRGGAPDNVTCVVADVIDTSDASADQGTTTGPQLVGAAAEALAPVPAPTTAGPEAGGGGTASDDSADSDDSAETDDSSDDDDDDDHRRGLGVRLLLPVVLLLAVAAGAFFGYRWTQEQYYVGAADGKVAIYQGVPQHLGGQHFSHVVSTTEMSLTDLPASFHDQVNATIPAKTLKGAQAIVDQLRQQAATCLDVPAPVGCTATGTPTPTPGTPSTSVTPTGTGTPTPSPSAT
jgi:serine/threonine protein phosphatase PrpC